MSRPRSHFLIALVSLIAGIALGSYRVSFKPVRTSASKTPAPSMQNGLPVLEFRTQDLEPQASNKTIVSIPVSYQPIFKKVVENGKSTLSMSKGHALIKVPAVETALILVDTWDEGTEEPSSYMKNLSELLSFCRRSGTVIIHAPSHPVVDKYPQYHALKNNVDNFFQEYPKETPPIFLRWPAPQNAIVEQTEELRKQGSNSYYDRYPAEERDISRHLKPLENEFVLSSHDELRFVLWKKQIKFIFYAGGAVNQCLIARPAGFNSLAGRTDTRTRFTIAVVDDCTIASGGPNADEEMTKKAFLDYFEAYAFATTLRELQSANPGFHEQQMSNVP